MHVSVSQPQLSWISAQVGVRYQDGSIEPLEFVVEACDGEDGHMPFIRQVFTKDYNNMWITHKYWYSPGTLLIANKELC